MCRYAASIYTINFTFAHLYICLVDIHHMASVDVTAKTCYLRPWWGFPKIKIVKVTKWSKKAKYVAF